MIRRGFLLSGAALALLTPFAGADHLAHATVILPVAAFAETSGTWVNVAGLWQSVPGAARPADEARPAWKVLRVLGNLLGLPGFDADSSQAVLAAALPGVTAGSVVDASRLSNTGAAFIDMNPAVGQPCVASIYQLDSLVRRASSLQLTADARAAEGAHA